MKNSVVSVTKVGCTVQTILVLISVILATKAFEYCLWTLTKKDVPWYLDLVGGIICNAFIFPAWFICYIGQLVGYSAPWLG